MSLKDAAQQLKRLADPIVQSVPEKHRQTLKLWGFALTQIPVLAFIGPKVIESGDERLVVKIPLNRRTRNHVGSMYFAVLAAGADMACGLLAVNRIDEKAPGKITLIFKDFKADFLKRAEGDVLFTCSAGREIAALVDAAIATGERQNLPVEVIATVPAKFGDEPVAKMSLTLSLKSK